jgi:hypothetical protein
MAAGFRPPPPEQAAPPIVATFFVEFLPNVKNEYALLEQASDGPLKISLPDRKRRLKTVLKSGLV